MKFRTEFTVDKRCTPLDVERPVVLLGSCFTDSIGKKMRESLWDAYPNTCGVLYNPASIANILELAMVCEDADIDNSIADASALNGNIWVSWLMDSHADRFSRDESRQIARNLICDLHRQLVDARALIITFGTSWVYELKDRDNYIVANCHKFPAETFKRRRLDIDEIVLRWNRVIDALHGMNEKLNVIFTVSPVRHLKDGFEGNSRSKATLLLACERICQSNPLTSYFPSYEILMDDLRDYRFYADDLVHPSDEGVEYIWGKFRETYLSPESCRILDEGLRITKALNHRPLLHDHSEEALRQISAMKEKAIKRYRDFISCHPGMLSTLTFQ